ncbi:ATP-dependent Clp protease ATP-binding subunit [Macrococcus epidermidis]|uniref:ATP-dependent Clp protease ATP-binding subunit n=1 Tax=Macrococcus epidermidis TaxID=1902580 RepID=A0A327ZV55_9STAP|nr:ATP-dependent Clp protease ATP-binding subunit [Macrococcus epidermidis]RAK45946.1 ATP-dependent Clp protease ATP-binding subunit [Macrococcus epidermidis]
MAKDLVGFCESMSFKVTRQCNEVFNKLKENKDLKLIQTQDLLLAMVETLDTGAGYALGKHSITKSMIKDVIDSATRCNERLPIVIEEPENTFGAKRRYEDAVKKQPAQICDEGISDVKINGIDIQVSKYVLDAFLYAEDMRTQNDPLRGIDTYWLLMGLAQNNQCNAFAIINKLMITKAQLTVEGLENHFSARIGFYSERRDGKMADTIEEEKNKQNRMNHKLQNPDYSLLNDLAADITELARKGELPKVIGREDELKQIEFVLSRRNKNNIALIGPGGVGKSAIAEGLAVKIVNGEMPSLQNKRILQFSMTDFNHITGSYTTNSEITLRFMEEMKRERDVILFIDEIHMLGNNKWLTDTLKPMMARGDFRVIGATTPNEWAMYIGSDSALVRRFEIVEVDEPSIEATIEIVSNTIHTYEHYHRVKINSDIIETSVHLAHKYLEHENMPDSVFTLIDNASTICKLEAGIVSQMDKEYIDNLNELKGELEASKQIEFNELAIEVVREKIEILQSEYNKARNANVEGDYELILTKDHLKEAIEYKSEKTVREFDLLDYVAREHQVFNNLKSLVGKMNKSVIGQPEAVEAVAQAVIRSKTGFRDNTKPAGVFMFLGTTGVGKTETAKVLAELLYGDDEEIVRFDMSEYQMPHEVSKLIGAPPGYIGYGSGGLLTNAVKKNPKAIILFDEVEKANEKVFDTLLQVFDDGRLTDGQGKTVDFTETIIILTSNLGASSIRKEKHVGFGAVEPSELDYQVVQTKSKEAAQEFFRPEFLNRIDEIITFKPFGKKEIFTITKLLVEKEIEKIEAAGYTAYFDDTAVQYIADTYYDPTNGSRPIKRGITKSIQNKLSSLLINGQLQKGKHIHITSDGTDIQMAVETVKEVS